MVPAQQQYPWTNAVPGVTRFNRMEAQRFCREILESDDYRKSLILRAKTGTLPAVVETMMWHYAYGKPTEQIELTVREDLTQLSTNELSIRAEAVLHALKEAESAEAAIDATGVVH